MNRENEVRTIVAERTWFTRINPPVTHLVMSTIADQPRVATNLSAIPSTKRMPSLCQAA